MSTQEQLNQCRKDLNETLANLNTSGKNHIDVSRDAQQLFLQESTLMSQLASENSTINILTCL
jgi:hypothetical protein